MKEIFVALSVALMLFANPPYIIDTLRGKTHPERVTWFIFAVLGIIAFVSQLLLGASWSLVFSGLDALAGVVIFGLSIKYGVGGHSRLDTSALVIAAVGVAIALLVKQPIISLLGAILADVSGTFLSVRKAFIEPGSETSITWLLIGTAAIFGCLSVGKFSVVLLLYPFYLVVANYAIYIAQFIGFALHGPAHGKFKA